MRTGDAEHERFPLLPLITGIFVCVLVLTPSASSKFITLGSLKIGPWSTGPLNIAGSTLFFPISYLFNDILTEVYGYKRSRRIIWIGFTSQVFAAAMYALIQVWPAAPFWHNQVAYESILGQAPRIVVASLTAYFVGEFLNSFVLSKLKYFVGGRAGLNMGIRFVASTFVGELFDSTIFMTVGFYGVFGNRDLFRVIVTIWLLKSLYEVVTLPISMPIAKWVKEKEGVDHIDYPERTNYAPFRF